MTPTDKLRDEVAKYYAWMTTTNNFAPDIRIKAWQDFIESLLLSERTRLEGLIDKEILEHEWVNKPNEESVVSQAMARGAILALREMRERLFRKE